MLRGDIVGLRAVEAEDLPLLLAWRIPRTWDGSTEKLV